MKTPLIASMLALLVCASFVPQASAAPILVRYTGTGTTLTTCTINILLVPAPGGYEATVNLQGSCVGLGVVADVCFVAGTVAGGLTSAPPNGNGCLSNNFGTTTPLTIGGTGVTLGTPSFATINGPIPISYAGISFTASATMIS